MTPERWRQIKEVLQSVLDIEHTERRAFLDKACGADQALRDEVESLLAYEELALSFLEDPAFPNSTGSRSDGSAEIPGPAMKNCLKCKGQYPREHRHCPEDGHLLSLPDPYKLVDRTLAGKYRLDALVDIGGMGAVYSAYHIGINRRVAFKILRPELALINDQVIDYFEREAQMAGQLRHENIVDVTDSGRTSDNHAYIVMEWLEGRTLKDVLTEYVPLDFQRIANVLRQICAGLEAAHAEQIIHRDIKPSNIMLIEQPNGREQVKVLDFGIGKVLSAATGKPVSEGWGTPRYASPEQIERRLDIDGRSDIYSLGVVLYDMLTGDLISPIPSTSIHNLLPGAPAAIERLLSRMLAREPDQRPQRASEVTALFEHALGNPNTSPIYESLVIGAAKPVNINKPPEDKASREVENYDVPEVWVEQASHLKTFVGREAVLTQLRNWVDASQDGGYLLLLGPWGQGKSALLAQFVERSKNEGLGCLFHTIKSKATPINILKFLIWQAEQLIGEPLSNTAYGGKVEDLRNSLVGALIRVCKYSGSILVVIDALDELDSSVKRLNFLPKYLPAGVRIILSCRDESPQASVLKNRLQPTVFPLPDLAREELPLFLESYLTPTQLSNLRSVDFDAVFHRIGGKPLILQRAIRIILEQVDNANKQGVIIPVIDVMTIPNTLDGVFEDIYNHITENVNDGLASRPGRIKERLIQLLSIAREALSIDDLYGLLRAEAEEVSMRSLSENRVSEAVWPVTSGEVRECVRQMSDNLLRYEDDRNEEGRFLHSRDGLVDYIRRKVMVREEAEALHRIFCRWLDSPQQRQAPSIYRIRHYPHHLYMSHNYDELERLLLQPGFLEDKLRLPATSFLAAEDIRYLTLALLARGRDRDVIDLAITEKGFQRNGVISALRDDSPELNARIGRMVDALLAADITSSSSSGRGRYWVSRRILRRRSLSVSTINAKRAAIEVAYHREMQEALVKVAQDPFPVVRTLLVPYLYYFWREHRDGGWLLMECLNRKLLKPWGLPDARILEAYGGMSLAILSYHFDDPEVLEQLRGQWQGNFRRILHVPQNSGRLRKFLFRSLFNLGIFILTNIVLKRLSDQPEFQPINTLELAASFPRSESGRHQLLAVLECLEDPSRGFTNCVDILLNSDTPFDVCLMVTLERAFVLHGSPGMNPSGVISALKRIYREGCHWFRRSSLYVAFHTLKNLDHVKDEWMESYESMTREMIRTTQATFKTARGAYSLIPDMAWAEVVFDKHRPSGQALFIPQFLREAVDSGDAEYARRAVAASGILSLVYQRHQLALDALRESLRTQDPKLHDVIVEVLTNIRFFNPDVVDDFLAKQDVKGLADQVERAIPTVKLADILQQFDEFFNHAMINSPIFRAEMVAAMRCAVQSRSLAQWGKDVLKRAMNLFLDEKLFPID